VTLPGTLPAAVRPLDIERLKPGEPHTPLIVMTVLTQLAVGTLATIWLVGLAGGLASPTVGLFVGLAVSGAALAAATLHLGRPIHAYRAMRMWRRSWLSREVVLFGAFSHVAAGYVAATWFGLPGVAIAGGLTTGLGWRVSLRAAASTLCPRVRRGTRGVPSCSSCSRAWCSVRS
jgi:hypothetical protein